MNPIIQKNLSAHRTKSFSGKLSDIQKELRERRKSFLGSYVSIRALVKEDSKVSDDSIQSLSQYLAKRTVALWNNAPYDAEMFSFRYYRIAINCLTYEIVEDECVDDIIQLAGCLVRSRKIFTMVGEKMLPYNMIGELFDFAESYDDVYFQIAFEDAVLGAISVLLGVLVDPIEDNIINEVRI